jgi:hypothetical protein
VRPAAGQDSGTEAFYRHSATESAPPLLVKPLPLLARPLPRALHRSSSSGVLATAVEALLRMRTDTSAAMDAADEDDDQSS